MSEHHTDNHPEHAKLGKSLIVLAFALAALATALGAGSHNRGGVAVFGALGLLTGIAGFWLTSPPHEHDLSCCNNARRDTPRQTD